MEISKKDVYASLLEYDFSEQELRGISPQVRQEIGTIIDAFNRGDM
ncbi:MAG: hypothetical protein PHE68_03860 [Candidatus Peribacteraceae bacterium]|nr:hypothetical protein [Candidatus Peribacteraceae bacterium]MDD5074898.1 hypothetical protein [Candidatus Peribacteraceae bacterium]